jgi:hypothetical protein
MLSSSQNKTHDSLKMEGYGMPKNSTLALVGSLTLTAGSLFGAVRQTINTSNAETRATTAELKLAALTDCVHARNVSFDVSTKTLIAENPALTGTNINMFRHVGASGMNIVEYAPGAMDGDINLSGLYASLPTTDKAIHADRKLPDGSYRVGPLDPTETAPSFGCK